MAEISSDLRSSEKEQAPQCGVAIIEDADIRRKAKTRWGLERPEKEPMALSQRKTGGSPGSSTETSDVTAPREQCDD